MSTGGRSTRGLESFSSCDDGAHRGEGASTRRAIANAALIRHRQKATPRNILKAPYDVWAKYVEWQLEWENTILRYRDGNNDEAERTLDDRRNEHYNYV